MDVAGCQAVESVNHQQVVGKDNQTHQQTKCIVDNQNCQKMFLTSQEFGYVSQDSDWNDPSDCRYGCPRDNHRLGELKGGCIWHLHHWEVKSWLRVKSLSLCLLNHYLFSNITIILYLLIKLGNLKAWNNVEQAIGAKQSQVHSSHKSIKL